MINPDLHIHTTASDGIRSPARIVKMAGEKGLNCIAITDHDTFSGLEEAENAAKQQGIIVVPGVEISTGGPEEIHVLGLGVKPVRDKLQAMLDHMTIERFRRFRTMGQRLREIYGMDLDMDKIMETAGDSIGRPHLARAMIEKGYVKTITEAFEKYISRGRPAYVPREKLAPTEAIRMLKESGAVPVIAHPMLIGWPMEKFLPILDEWQKAGLMGMEVYHPANRGYYPMLDRIARERGLLVTGGSDYHDEEASHGQLGETVDEWPTHDEDAKKLLACARHIGEID